MKRFLGKLPGTLKITVSPSDLSSEKLKVWLSTAGTKLPEFDPTCTEDDCTARQVGFGHCEDHYGK